MGARRRASKSGSQGRREWREEEKLNRFLLNARHYNIRRGSRNARVGDNEVIMELDGGTVDYRQTCTCNPSDVIAYTSVKISTW